MKYKKTILNIFHDSRGTLMPFEFSNLSFVPKRIFIINGVPTGSTRGNHSHFTTKQFLICTKGKLMVKLDDGYNKETVLLNSNEAILIPELVWDSQEFLEENTEIAVVCSTEYHIKDYILIYEDFLKIINSLR